MGKFKKFLEENKKMFLAEVSDDVLNNSADEADEAILSDLKSMGYGDYVDISNSTMYGQFKRGRMFGKKNYNVDISTLKFEEGIDILDLAKDLKRNGYSFYKGKDNTKWTIKKDGFIYDLFIIKINNRDPYVVIHALSKIGEPVEA